MAYYIDIIKEIGPLLLTITSPSRYVGGEWGRRAKKDAGLQTVIAFPDLYEIGMSNNALKILYNRINDLDDVSCDRVFAPAPDFEALLKEKNIPLYALDTGLSLKDSDILMFTLSYELGITGVLSILESAGIGLRAKDRCDSDPIIIAGGPSISNPLPYSRFFDFFWIGEAEDDFFNLVENLRDAKKAGAQKAALCAIIAAHPSVWFPGKKNTRRAIDNSFGKRGPQTYIFPVPSMRIVQQHASVEIMRGCPNGCRFCFAGIWYRPMRQKSADIVLQEVSEYIKKGGFREISLSSLSSGDYKHIDSLVDTLNREFSAARVSFQLPSLRVSTLSLDLLEKISQVRKSGLTFAVETPLDVWQIAINKEVTLEKTCALLLEAKKHGYKSAKFYFMIGLPVLLGNEDISEEDAIIAFINEAAARTKMTFHINVGIFTPKAHTPFQWAPLLDMESAREKLFYLVRIFKKSPHKISVHDPLVSCVEGIISRGDERVGELIEKAYFAGCRLDAWNEHFKRDVWLTLLNDYNDLVVQLSSEKDSDSVLPWDDIQSGTSKSYIKEQWQKSRNREFSPVCTNNCPYPCGVCTKTQGIVENNIHINKNCLETCDSPENLVCNNRHENNTHLQEKAEIPCDKKDESSNPEKKQNSELDTYRVLFSYSKEGSAVFLSHLAMIEVFSGALLRAGLPIMWTQGFNPLPKIDFASPLSLGIGGEQEIALVDVREPVLTDDFVACMNQCLPEGLSIKNAAVLTVPAGTKKYSLNALLSGFVYENGDGRDCIEAKDDKSYRLARFPGNNIFGLKRIQLLAKNPRDPNAAPSSYFDIYSLLYPG
ncbi:MAG: TIGR03936 family radical SAM-associated protein [Spirochaetaceae bacterium]|jgi:radical SAM superfamily enzyme YgiQ (UPF0313 family)|nr:TIGR03936 family radical SAM-associated protein [Spirochaetaceae bacterium]